jgi:hypothetical protein
MGFSHFGLLGLIGIVVCLAGAHLLWNDRRLAAAWLREIVRALRGQVGGSQATALRRLPGAARTRTGALALAGGVALIIIGQFLFLFDLIH